MTLRAVLYARVSSDDRGKDGRNLDEQLRECREHARAQGWSVVAELAEDDRGASGAVFDLPALNQALEMARSQQFDVLIVREIDRFARKLAKQLVVEEEFRRFGILIEYVLDEFPDTPEGNLQKNIKATIAEYEREKIQQRMTRGRRNYVRRGGVLLHGRQPPYGYRISDDGKELVIQPDEAEIIKLIFQWYTDGDENGRLLGMKAIATRLTAMGIPTWKDLHPDGGTRKLRPHGTWVDGTIYRMISNETYAGTWHYGRTNKKIKGGTNPKEYWIPVSVPAIISRPLWERTQKQKAENRQQARRKRKYDYLVSNRCYCGQCGCRVHGSSVVQPNRIYQYYFCDSHSGYSKSLRPKCDLPRFNAGEVDAIVWQFVRDMLSDPHMLESGLKEARERQGSRLAPLRQRREIIQALLHENSQQTERLIDLFVMDGVPKDVLVERQKRLQDTAGKLTDELHSLDAQLSVEQANAEYITELVEYANRVADGLKHLESDFGAKKLILQRLGIRVTLDIEDGNKIVYIYAEVFGPEPICIANGIRRNTFRGRASTAFSTARTSTYWMGSRRAIHFWQCSTRFASAANFSSTAPCPSPTLRSPTA